MNTVIDGFQLGRLIDHVFRRRHFAAIVKPACDVQFVPFVLIEIKISERAVFGFAGRLCQHFG